MAAVLARGDGAVLSHQSAAVAPPAHVTILGDAGRARREGIVLHRSSTLLPSHTTMRPRPGT
jgi:hypothetical protein